MKQLQRFWKTPDRHNGIFAAHEDRVKYYLYEEYGKKIGTSMSGAYYMVKPLLPRWLQIFLRREYARFQKNRFPRWPIDETLENLRTAPFKGCVNHGGTPYIWFWPSGKKFTFVITHDVESEKGLRNIAELCAIEEDLGLRSAFFFVGNKYPIDEALINTLRDKGFEVAIHGWKHDGKLFSSRAIFKDRLNKLISYKSRWGAVGFRSPSLLRNIDWMCDLPFEYDSSFPDTDPFGPQGNGCLSIFPFFIGDIVELPITLAQDHTLFSILGQSNIETWKDKIDWIEEKHGLAMIIVHPDYLLQGCAKKLYRDVLAYILKKENVWFALPREVAEWWRNRDASSLQGIDEKYEIVGPARDLGAISYIRGLP